MRGAAGSTVTATVGVQNRGSANIDYSRGGYPAQTVRVLVPAGTTVTSVPESCYPHFGDKSDWEHPGQPGHRAYLCITDYRLRVGETVVWDFKLKLKTAESTSGMVGVNFFSDHPDPRERIKDSNPADDDAVISVNPVGEDDHLPRHR